MKCANPILALLIATTGVSTALARTEATSTWTPALCKHYSGIPAGFGSARGAEPNRAGMVPIPAGRFRMGSNDGYPEERAVHEVRVGAFWIDRHEVTNAQFASFVQATGYITRAERTPDAAEFPGVAADRLKPGSAVFVQPRRGEHLRGAYDWWRWVPGANWRHPQGPSSDIRGKENNPVVHIAYEDALAYAKWLGRDLPTEAQWEYAARGGLDGATYPWGNTPDARGRPRANTWQGPFPSVNEAADGFDLTAPVGCYPSNDYGLYDVVGNVWELTRDVYRDRHSVGSVENPMVATLAQDGPRAVPATASRVIKGGSFLCAPNFCVRYRPSSRQPQEAGLGAMHVGFRTVVNDSE